MLHINGAIDETTYAAVAEYLNGDPERPTIYINSGGGEHLDAVAIWSLIKGHDKKVTTIAVGRVHSAAVLIFAAGDIRKAYQDTWFMVHEDTGKLSGNTTEFKKEAETLERLEQHWAQMMERATDTEAKVWDKMSRETTYFTAHQAFSLNLVQHFIKEKP